MIDEFSFEINCKFALLVYSIFSFPEYALSPITVSISVLVFLLFSIIFFNYLPSLFSPLVIIIVAVITPSAVIAM